MSPRQTSPRRSPSGIRSPLRPSCRQHRKFVRALEIVSGLPDEDAKKAADEFRDLETGLSNLHQKAVDIRAIFDDLERLTEGRASVATTQTSPEPDPRLRAAQTEIEELREQQKNSDLEQDEIRSTCEEIRAQHAPAKRLVQILSKRWDMSMGALERISLMAGSEQEDKNDGWLRARG
ncbi:hypothetical protein B0A50_07686 [Salinomyces thailandicus]|uniref:Uncharacterized protein n=1 Tax=Salinomyces thailandicus TaxID=706561 RepID=A0A4U0TM05_9PEZI|nr:hypothetical protein B0A50_07686 [Salinomyces thailandica]